MFLKYLVYDGFEIFTVYVRQLISEFNFIIVADFFDEKGGFFIHWLFDHFRLFDFREIGVDF